MCKLLKFKRARRMDRALSDSIIARKNKLSAAFPRCPHCGAANFSVTQDKRDALVIAPNAQGKLIVVARRPESIVNYEWIYCEICGQRVARRSDWAAKGIEVPE